MGKQNNEYDSMSKMLENMRNGMAQAKKRINEEMNTDQLQPSELEDEQNKFKEALGGTVEFGPFKIYKESNNIEFSGVLTADRIQWNFSLDDSIGCYISCQQTQLTDETVQNIQKLKGYYNTWAEYWSDEIS